MVSKLSFCLHLQQVIAQLGELHIFGAPAPCRSSPGGVKPGQSGVCTSPLSSLWLIPWLRKHSGAGEGSCACAGCDRGDQRTCVLLFLCLPKRAPHHAAGALGNSHRPGDSIPPSYSLTRPWCWLGSATACLWAQGLLPGHQLCLIMSKSNSLVLKGCPVSFTPAMAFSHSALPMKK